MWRRFTLVWILVVFLQACGQVPLGPNQVTLSSVAGQASLTPMLNSTNVVPSPTLSETPDILHTPNPTATSTITSIPLTATPTLTACMRAGGRVEVNEFTTVLLHTPLVYRIYLPPCYDEEPERVYPVLYLIHGQTYSDTQWDRLGAPEAADKLIATGEVTPFIIVMPRDRVWLEPTEDNFGKAVEQALIPWVDELYRTIPDRDHRAIGGLSRGGAWAIHEGLSRWDLFSAVGMHSGFVFYSDVQPLYLWLYNIPAEMMPRIYMDVGDEDRPEIAKSATWLEDLLTQLDIPHEWHMFVGEHEEAYWQVHVEDYLRWYTLDWGK